MSFRINKPCRARSGPDMAATGSREPDRRRFELTVARQAPGESPRLERRQPWLPTRSERRQDLSLFVVGEGLYDPPALVSSFQRGGRGSPWFGALVRQN